ncbi:MAG TPA: methyltransferase domain-containing protein [Noviherbaspirillum sp.]
MLTLQDWLHLVICPDCGSRRIVNRAEYLQCAECGMQFPVVHGRPVLLAHSNRVFRAECYTAATVKARVPPAGGLKRFIPDISVNVAREKSLAAFKRQFDSKMKSHVLVIGGGTQRNELDRAFTDAPHIHLIYCDIDVTADVECFCDAHALPFADQSIQGVITTAVLEHVMYPEQAAAEISRVMATGGVLYSELPFMQQVHEGAYDFTRYTLSGHRRLFNRFMSIESGMVAGPATSLVWAIEHFALAFFRSGRPRLAAKALVRLGFFWIKYLDYWLCRQPQATDGACCTYFLGRKSSTAIPDDEIISGYVGGKVLRHT